jgi:guanylate kinase
VGHRYGTLRREIEGILGAGRIAVLDIEVQGARQVRRHFPDAVHVFILPPSGAALAARLRGRLTEGKASYRTRLLRAAQEMLAVDEYDYVVVNDDLAVAVEQVADIVGAEGRRVPRRDKLMREIEELRREVMAEAEAADVQ